MKEKITMLVIGFLIGAIMASGAFLIYTKTNNTNCNTKDINMNGGNPPTLPNGENGTPPEMPNNENRQSREKANGENENFESKKHSKKSNNDTATKKSNTEIKENN